MFLTLTNGDYFNKFDKENYENLTQEVLINGDIK